MQKSWDGEFFRKMFALSDSCDSLSSKGKYQIDIFFYTALICGEITPWSPTQFWLWNSTEVLCGLSTILVLFGFLTLTTMICLFTLMLTYWVFGFIYTDLLLFFTSRVWIVSSGSVNDLVLFSVKFTMVSYPEKLDVSISLPPDFLGTKYQLVYILKTIIVYLSCHILIRIL